MGKDIYLIEKSTDTFADNLVFAGAGYIINKIARQAPRSVEVRLKDCGGYFGVFLSRPLDDWWIEQCDYFTPVPLIVTTDKQGNRKPMGHPPMRFINYEVERSRNNRYFELLKQLPPAARRPGATVDEFPELRDVQMQKPLPEWPIYAIVNQMSAINAYNGMVMAWYEAKEKGCFAQQLRLILQMFEQIPNNVDGVSAAWKKLKKEFKLSTKPDASATQVYNPATGKGANKTKADNLSIGGLNNFWLLEYLKLIGMFQVGLPRTVKGVKDRKTYVLLPNDIPFNTNRKLYKDFNEIMYADTAIKMDIIAALRYAAVFLKQWRAGQRRPGFWHTFTLSSNEAQNEAPQTYVNGLAMTFYKDMGSAHAVLNQSTISLPDWIGSMEPGPNGIAQASLFLKIVDEHEKVIRPLDEKRNLDYELLRTYRDFLSSGRLADFFEFTGKYSSYLTQKFEQKESYLPKRFETKHLEVLIMSHDKKLKEGKKLEPIVQNEGFQRIARAIRQSTVQAQYFRHQKRDRRYEIRYGLGQDLIRKGKYPHEFVKALTEFLAKYSNENAMVEEHTARQYGGTIPPEVRRTLRPGIKKTDINEIVRLVDEYDDDSELICNLLVAYGYASDYRQNEVAGSDEETEVGIEADDEKVS